MDNGSIGGRCREVGRNLISRASEELVPALRRVARGIMKQFDRTCFVAVAGRGQDWLGRSSGPVSGTHVACLCWAVVEAEIQSQLSSPNFR